MDGTAVVVVEVGEESELLGGLGVVDGDGSRGVAGALGEVVVDDVVGGEADEVGEGAELLDGDPAGVALDFGDGGGGHADGLGDGGLGESAVLAGGLDVVCEGHVAQGTDLASGASR